MKASSVAKMCVEDVFPQDVGAAGSSQKCKGE